MHGIVGRAKTTRRAASGAREGCLGHVRIPEKLDRALTRIAARTGKPRSYFVRKGLERIIEDAHDRLLAAEALKRSRGKTYSLREVEKRLGLELSFSAEAVRQSGRLDPSSSGESSHF